ncbi:hypothetical protein C4566_00435, partial [Candidatus Parcubacteria bacterium]
RLRAQFDASVKTNYDTLHHVNSDEWHPIKIGEEYYLAQKFHTNFWPLRSDNYFISNGETDANGAFVVKDSLDDDAMKHFFKTGSAKGLASYPGEEELKVDAPTVVDKTDTTFGERPEVAPQEAVSDQNTEQRPELKPNVVPDEESIKPESVGEKIETTTKTETVAPDQQNNAGKNVEAVEDTLPRVESDSRLGSFEAGETKVTFEYDQNGRVVSYESNGTIRGGGLDALKDDYRANIIDHWQKSGGKGDLEFEIDKVRLDAQTISLNRSILEEMRASGHGDTAEARFIEQNIETRINSLESKFGDIFKEEKVESATGVSLENPVERPEQPKDLFEDAEVESTPKVEAGQEDLNSALAVLAKGLKVDKMTVDQIEAMDDPAAIRKLGASLNSLIAQAEGDPASEHTLRGLERLYGIIDDKLVSISAADSALSALSAGENLPETLTLKDIATMDDVKVLESLRTSAQKMMEAVANDSDLADQAGGLKQIIGAVDKRITDLKA